VARSLRQAVFFFALLLSSCETARKFSDIRNLASRGENIICFGDSLTEGVGAENGEGYPSLVARNLHHPVINAGRRGDASADGLSRLQQDVLARNPRLVIVLFGGNDFFRRVPLEQTRRNIEEIVRRIQEHGAMVALVGLRLGLFTDEYGPVFKEIAKKHGALFVGDVLRGILSDPKLRSDTIHPNGAGYRLVAERILKEIKPLLEEADRQRLKG